MSAYVFGKTEVALDKRSRSSRCTQELGSSLLFTRVSSASTSLLHRFPLHGGSWFMLSDSKLKKIRRRKRFSPLSSPQLPSLAHSSKSLEGLALIGCDWSRTHSQANHWVQEEVVLWLAKPRSRGHSWNWNKLTAGLKQWGGNSGQIPKEGGIGAVKANLKMSTIWAKEQEKHTQVTTVKISW